MRARLVLAVPLLAAALAAAPVTAGPRQAARSVAPGYDLFVTPDGSRLDVAGLPAMTFRGVPLRTFDFAGVGTRRVAEVDTIVRRLDTATPASPRVRIELVGMLLQSTNVPGYFVTLQSARPLGLPSTGTLDIVFDQAGRGGTLRSDLMVNYDVRRGSPDGPIVYTGSTGMGFVAEDVLWAHSADDDSDACRGWCISRHPDGTICHEAGEPFPVHHLHCVEPIENIGPITGVNHRLNGRDTSADFHPIGQVS